MSSLHERVSKAKPSPLFLVETPHVPDEEIGLDTSSSSSSSSSVSSSSPTLSGGEKSMTVEQTLENIPGEAYFAVWFTLNVGITLLNKIVFTFVDFQLPITLSALHMLVTGLLSYLSVHVWEIFPAKEMDDKESYAIYGLSLLFCVNIVAGNVSIWWVHISFLQVVRACIPAITMGLAYLILNDVPTVWRVVAIIPVCVGVMFTVVTELDISVSAIGLSIVLGGAVLSALKGVMCKKFLTARHPIDLLSHIAPLACVEMTILAYLFGEYNITIDEAQRLISAPVFGPVLFTAVVAFVLNVTNFYTNKKSSPLTLTIGGNVKQVVTIFLSLIIWSTTLTLSSYIGIFITICGAAFYSYVRYNKM